MHKRNFIVSVADYSPRTLSSARESVVFAAEKAASWFELDSERALKESITASKLRAIVAASVESQ